MLKIRKVLLTMMSLLVLTAGISLSTKNVQASEKRIDTTVIDEKWGKPTFVYGGGLSESQIDNTIKLLDIEEINNVNSMPVTGEDLANYLNEGAADTSVMISSVLVQKKNSGTGVEVLIKTPENITEITEEQYTNAAITAGVSDAQILVASVSRVTGESALTGIYKAFDVNGEGLEQDRMEVAQEELETTNAIAQENQDQEGFETDRLNQAIIEIKQELADLKDQVGNLATREDIERIINDALANNQLEDYVTQEQFQRLLDLFEKYQSTSAIDSAQVKEQLKDLSEEVKNRVSGLIDQAEESGIIDRIGTFFKEVWQSIRNLFN